MNILKAGQTLGEQLAGRWRCSTLPPVADYMEMWVPICFLDLFSPSRGIISFCVDSGPIIMFV